MSLPQNFKELSYALDKSINFKNILIVNTPRTGEFLHSLFREIEPTLKVVEPTLKVVEPILKVVEPILKVVEPTSKRITAICYSPNNYTRFSELNKKFDLICVDPYHEYKDSIEIFRLLISLLDDDGILISHDCNPPNFKCSFPTNIRGEWCGVTYAAFIEIAYDNPDWFYAVINRDYGLGIISKKPIEYVKKIEDREKQKIFLDIFRDGKYKEAYDYFK